MYPNGSIKDGYMPRVTNLVCQSLNLTPIYVKIADPKVAGRLPNGTFVGGLRQVADQEYHGSIWGWGYTWERAEIVDFVNPFADVHVGFIIKRPRSDDISLVNYVSEFKTRSWQAILVVNVAFWVLFWIALHFRPHHSSLPLSLNLAITIMLRTLINKVCVSRLKCIPHPAGLHFREVY